MSGLLRHPDSIRYNDARYGLWSIPHSSPVGCAGAHRDRDAHTGQTVADLRGQGSAPNVTVAFGVDAARLTALWVERVRNLAANTLVDAKAGRHGAGQLCPWSRVTPTDTLNVCRRYSPSSDAADDGSISGLR
jgi:hypothetical protein